jgi:hypothetical protein
MSVKYFDWDDAKNAKLRAKRGIGFEDVVFHIECARVNVARQLRDELGNVGVATTPFARRQPPCFVWPPNLESFSKRCTRWRRLKKCAAAKPEMPAPITATVFIDAQEYQEPSFVSSICP